MQQFSSAKERIDSLVEFRVIDWLTGVSLCQIWLLVLDTEPHWSACCPNLGRLTERTVRMPASGKSWKQTLTLKVTTCHYDLWLWDGVIVTVWQLDLWCHPCPSLISQDYFVFLHPIFMLGRAPLVIPNRLQHCIHQHALLVFSAPSWLLYMSLVVLFDTCYCAFCFCFKNPRYYVENLTTTQD